MQPPPSAMIGQASVVCSAKDLVYEDTNIVHSRIFTIGGHLAYWIADGSRNERSRLLLFDPDKREWNKAKNVKIRGQVPTALAACSSSHSYTSVMTRSWFIGRMRTMMCRVGTKDGDPSKPGDPPEVELDECWLKHRYEQAVETSAEDWEELQQEYRPGDGPVLFGLRAGYPEVYLIDTRPDGTKAERKLTNLDQGVKMLFAHEREIFMLNAEMRNDRGGLARFLVLNARRGETRQRFCERDTEGGFPLLPKSVERVRWFHVQDSNKAYLLDASCFFWRLTLDSLEWLKLHPRLECIIRPETAKILHISRCGLALVAADDRVLKVSLIPQTPLAVVRRKSKSAIEEESAVENSKRLTRLVSTKMVFSPSALTMYGIQLERTRVFVLGGLACYWDRSFSLGVLRRARYTLCFRGESDFQWRHSSIVVYGSTPKVVPADANNAFVFFDRFLFRRIVYRSVARLCFLPDSNKLKMIGRFYIRGRHATGQITWQPDRTNPNPNAGRMVTFQATSTKLRTLTMRKKRETRISTLNQRQLLRFAFNDIAYLVNESVLKSADGITSLVAYRLAERSSSSVDCVPDIERGYPVCMHDDEWMLDKKRNFVFTLDREAHLWRLELTSLQWHRVDPQLPGISSITNPTARILSITTKGQIYILINDHIICTGIDQLDINDWDSFGV